MQQTRPGLWTVARRARLAHVLALYLSACFVVLQVVELFMEQLGLPDWLFGGAIVLLVAGLPIMVATALVQAAFVMRAEASAAEGPAAPAGAVNGLVGEAPQARPAAGRLSRMARSWFTWRRSLLGGVAAFVLLALGTTGYVGMRTLGIGPVGSLVAAGAIDPRDAVLLAEFRSQTGDSLLARVVTDAFRVDLAQSTALRIADAPHVRDMLTRMGRPATTPLTAELAQEAAVREGIKAYVTGEIGAAGTGYLLTARIVAASGAVLASYRESARADDALLPAIDRLSRKLREKSGESLRAIRAEAPLAQVTTSSLEALRAYTLAYQADADGDLVRATALLEEAVALDPGFAMAWRKLGVAYGSLERRKDALRRAYENRDRLTERERLHATAVYNMYAEPGADRAIAAYETLLRDHPDDIIALHNVAQLYRARGDHALAEAAARRALRMAPGISQMHVNLVTTLLDQGKFDAADSAVAALRAAHPDNPRLPLQEARVTMGRGDYDAAERALRALLDVPGGRSYIHANARYYLGLVQLARGKLDQTRRLWSEYIAMAEALGGVGDMLDVVGDLAWAEAVTGGNVAAGIARVNEALARHPLDSIPAADAALAALSLARVYALAGDAPRTGALLASYAPEEAPLSLGNRLPDRASGVLALQQGRFQDAIRDFRAWDALAGACRVCAQPWLGRAYEAAGQADSAIAAYERFVYTPTPLDNIEMADLIPTLERLATLHEERGERDKAATYYARVVELWQDADPELRPRVEAARRGLARVAGERPSPP